MNQTIDIMINLSFIIFLQFIFTPFFRKYNYAVLMRRNLEWTEENADKISPYKFPPLIFGSIMGVISISLILLDHLVFKKPMLSNAAYIMTVASIAIQFEFIDKRREQKLISMIPKTKKKVLLQKRVLSLFINPKYYRPLYALIPIAIIISVFLGRAFDDRLYIFLYGYHLALAAFIIFPKQMGSLEQMHAIRNLAAKMLIGIQYVAVTLHIIRMSLYYLSPSTNTDSLPYVYISSIAILFIYAFYTMKKENN